MLCSKLHCQKGFNLNLFSYKIRHSLGRRSARVQAVLLLSQQLAQCLGQHILLDVQGAVLALVVRQYDTNLSVAASRCRAKEEQLKGLKDFYLKVKARISRPESGLGFQVNVLFKLFPLRSESERDHPSLLERRSRSNATSNLI